MSFHTLSISSVWVYPRVPLHSSLQHPAACYRIPTLHLAKVSRYAREMNVSSALHHRVLLLLPFP